MGLLAPLAGCPTGHNHVLSSVCYWLGCEQGWPCRLQSKGRLGLASGAAFSNGFPGARESMGPAIQQDQLCL